MKTIIIAVFLLGLILPIHAQEVVVSAEDQMTIFIGFIIAVAAIFIYLARDMILRKKTAYDEKNLESQKNKDYDKYHSDWNDDYEDLGSRNRKPWEKFNTLDIESLPDLYAILDIQKDATSKEIKQQYRKLAKQSHPDKSTQQDAKETMAQINQAYEILSDPQQRAQYDLVKNIDNDEI